MEQRLLISTVSSTINPRLYNLKTGLSILIIIGGEVIILISAH
ncbi:MAG: hypothetical protein ACLQG5_09350 [Methanobacterium sp.]